MGPASSFASTDHTLWLWRNSATNASSLGLGARSTSGPFEVNWEGTSSKMASSPKAARGSRARLSFTKVSCSPKARAYPEESSSRLAHALWWADSARCCSCIERVRPAEVAASPAEAAPETADSTRRKDSERVRSRSRRRAEASATAAEWAACCASAAALALPAASLAASIAPKALRSDWMASAPLLAKALTPSPLSTLAACSCRASSAAAEAAATIRGS
mmetsp:Transcript_54186/g.117068  ORF Transcript_54186/g.117068 Transcript_54186/m.117068 type:complete len:220 (+) Transcript_54186:144-803(+)